MNGHKVTRRDLLKWSLGAGVSTAMLEGLGQMTNVPGWHQLLGGSHLPNPHWAVKDSFELTRYLGQLGSTAQLASLFQMQEAMAQAGSSEWSLITIKVFDQVHHPLVFALGQIAGDNVTSSSLSKADHPATNLCSTATAEHLTGAGIKNLSKDSRFAALRFNDWFGKRLKYGTYNGVPKTDNTAQHFNYDSYINEFPSNVALQVGLGVQPLPGFSVHQLGLGKLRKELADLAHVAASKGFVQSPLGITCLMMGNEYDHNGSVPKNQVYNSETKAEVIGRNLGSLVKNIDQSLNDGFGDFRNVNQNKNLTYLLDKLSVKSPQRRLALIDSRDKLSAAIKDMKTLAARELQPLYVPPTTTEFDSVANKQAKFVEGQGTYNIENAKQEFVSHCAFVAKALSVTGQPYRNFSLFLNLNDLDGKPIDAPENPSISFRANSLNYVEGMRQLAMGLNILANAISGKKAIVVVIADGGRDRAMGDGSGSAFAMMMGPKGPGMLDDHLHANMTVFNSNDYATGSTLQNLGSTTTGLGWTTSGNTWGLYEPSGVRAAAGEQTNMGDWQVGVLDFLGSMLGKNIMSTDYGRFVRFKRMA